MTRSLRALTQLLALSLAACSSSSTNSPSDSADAMSDAAVGDATTDAAPDAAGADAGTSDTAPDAAGGELVEARLYRYLEGRFDSADQAAAQPTYYAISLAVCEATLEGEDARALYVEQAFADTPAEPYRQRVYLVEPVDATTAVTTVLALENPAAWVGACDDGTQPAFVAADVSLRDGCGVTMTWDGEQFDGGTTGTDCASDINGASYATSDVTITETQMSSWDRGFDAAGTQVWGAVDGPYVFVRRTELLPAE